MACLRTIEPESFSPNTLGIEFLKVNKTAYEREFEEIFTQDHSKYHSAFENLANLNQVQSDLSVKIKILRRRIAEARPVSSQPNVAYKRRRIKIKIEIIKHIATLSKVKKNAVELTKNVLLSTRKNVRYMNQPRIAGLARLTRLL